MSSKSISSSSSSSSSPKKNENVDLSQALAYRFPESTYNYTWKDVALYNLAVGAASSNVTDESQLQFTYENASNFSALPSMGVIFPFDLLSSVMSVPGLKFNPMLLLHGEQFLEIKNPIPLNGNLVNSGKIKNIYDKGKSALVILEAETRDKSDNNKLIVKNEFSLFIRGIGGFGGDRGPNVENAELTNPPKREPDAVLKFKTNENQALIYRLASGDMNPLHADPSMAAMGGFDRPILHGLCTFGVATRGVVEKFCGGDASKVKSLRARFSKHVFPGETLSVEMWRVNPQHIVFRVKVEERGEYAITNAVAEIAASSPSEKSKL